MTPKPPTIAAQITPPMLAEIDAQAKLAGITRGRAATILLCKALCAPVPALRKRGRIPKPKNDKAATRVRRNRKR